MTPKQYVEQKAASSGSSFYYAFLFLPKERRAAITAFYAFCREVDDVVDEVQDPGVAATKLAWWQSEVAKAYVGQPSHPVMKALMPLAAAYKIEARHLLAVIEGCQMDLAQNRYLDFAGLQRYCHLVAGIVGEVAANIFGQTQPETTAYAHKLGLAFQLTNIIRDVGEDAQRGRIYLPVNELQQFEVKVHELLKRERAFGLELHQCDEAVRVLALQNLVRLDVKLLQLIDGQVNAATQRIFTHVADDVGELKSQPQLVRVGGGRLVGLAKNTCGHLADDARHQMAIALQAWKVEVTVLLQIHLAAFNHGVQMARFNPVSGSQWHQGLHDGVAGLARKRLGDFTLPPRKLGSCDAGVYHFIDDIVNLAAKGVKRRDGGAPLFG